MSGLDYELIDIDCIYHTETEKAILVSEDGDEDNARWLPKSKIEYDDESALRRGDHITISVERWLAEREWLV
jgi:hypothetical protein